MNSFLIENFIYYYINKLKNRNLKLFHKIHFLFDKLINVIFFKMNNNLNLFQHLRMKIGIRLKKTNIFFFNEFKLKKFGILYKFIFHQNKS